MVHGLFRASGIVMFYRLHHDFSRREARSVQNAWVISDEQRWVTSGRRRRRNRRRFGGCAVCVAKCMRYWAFSLSGLFCHGLLAMLLRERTACAHGVPGRPPRFRTFDAMRQKANFLRVSFDPASQFGDACFPLTAARAGEGKFQCPLIFPAPPPQDIGINITRLGHLAHRIAGFQTF